MSGQASVSTVQLTTAILLSGNLFGTGQSAANLSTMISLAGTIFGRSTFTGVLKYVKTVIPGAVTFNPSPVSPTGTIDHNPAVPAWISATDLLANGPPRVPGARASTTTLTPGPATAVVVGVDVTAPVAPTGSAVTE